MTLGGVLNSGNGGVPEPAPPPKPTLPSARGMAQPGPSSCRCQGVIRPKTAPLRAPPLRPNPTPPLKKPMGVPFRACLGPSPCPGPRTERPPPERLQSPKASPEDRALSEPRVEKPADPVDPLARALALPAMRTPEPPPATSAPAAARLPDEVALERLVKRFAWGGNGKRGTARIELGAGPLSGATLLLSGEGRELRLEIEGADEGAARAFVRRLEERLSAKGLTLETV